MKIYIDGLFYKGSGIGRYYESLVKEFAKRGLKIYTCAPIRLKNDFEKDFKDVIQNIEPIFVDYEKFSIKGFIKQSIILKRLETKVELFFYPHINLPLYVPKNTIITIHDLRPLTEFWDRSELKRKIFSCYLDRVLNKSKGIITISYSVAKELRDKFNNIGNKIEVIYEFIDEKFYNYATKEKPTIEDDYVLFIGNRKKHKNLKNLILAFDKIKHKIDVKLVIAGSKDNKNIEDEIDIIIKNLNLKNRIIEILSPSDDELINLYQHAKLFVFPSLFEGFGLPPLEAIALGCPVIASNIPVLKEILGEKIACFNPYNVDGITDKLYNVLINENLKLELLTEGEQRLAQYDKNRIIDEHLEYFNRIVGEKLK